MSFLKGLWDYLTIYFRRPKFFVILSVIISSLILTAWIYSSHNLVGVPIYLVDHDNSRISRTLRLFFESNPDIRVIGSPDTIEEAQEAMKFGKVSTIVYIPADFEKQIKRQAGANVHVYQDGSSYLLMRNADKAVQTTLKTASVGIAAISLEKKGMSSEASIPALMPIRIDVEQPFNPMTLYTYYLMPVFLFFGVYLFLVIMTQAMFVEKTPYPESFGKRTTYRSGGALVNFLIAMLWGLLILLVFLPKIGIEMHSSVTMFLMLQSIFLLLTMGFVAVINVVLSAFRTLAAQACYLFTMLSLMISGLTWPLESMPWPIQWLSSLMPLTPFLQSLQIILAQPATWHDLHTFTDMFLRQLVLYAGLIVISVSSLYIVRELRVRRVRLKAEDLS